MDDLDRDYYCFRLKVNENQYRVAAANGKAYGLVQWRTGMVAVATLGREIEFDRYSSQIFSL